MQICLPSIQSDGCRHSDGVTSAAELHQRAGRKCMEVNYGLMGPKVHVGTRFPLLLHFFYDFISHLFIYFTVFHVCFFFS